MKRIIIVGETTRAITLKNIIELFIPKPPLEVIWVPTEMDMYCQLKKENADIIVVAMDSSMLAKYFHSTYETRPFILTYYENASVSDIVDTIKRYVSSEPLY